MIISVLKIEENVEFVADVRAKARNLKQSLLKYETILLAQIFLNIFNITEPLSKYLQTQDIDILKSYQLVSSALAQLRAIQRDINNIKLLADGFVKWANEEFANKNF